MARPEKTIDWDLVDRMIEAQCNAKEIAGGVNMSVDRFYERFKEHHKKNFADYVGEKAPYGLGLIRLAQFQKTLNNRAKGNTQLLQWMGKVLLGQTEAVPSKDVTPQNDDFVSIQNENMLLKHQIATLQEKLDSICNKPKTE